MFIKSFSIRAIIFISLVFFLYYSVSSFALDDTEKIRVGYYISNGFQDKGYNQSYTGFGFDYYKLIQQYTDWEYEFIEADFVDCLEMLEKGELDIVGGLVKSPEKADFINYTTLPYLEKQYQLFTKINNENLYYESFEDFEDMVIGIVNGNQQIEKLENYAKENGFEYKLVFYSSLFEMESAIKYGQVDAIFSSNVTEMNHYKIIARLSKVPLYFGVSKERTDLLDELNSALKNIVNINPNFPDFLHEKYKNKNLCLIPSFTKSEAEYRDTCPLIFVIVKDNSQPLISYDSKARRYKGIFYDIFEYIGTLTGLDFVFCTLQQVDELKIQYPDANFVSIVDNDFSGANNRNFNISNTVLHSQLVLVSKEIIGTKHNLSLAMPKEVCTIDLVEKDKYKYNYNIVYMDTIEDCLKAVNKGVVDATCLIEFASAYYLGSYEYDHLYASYYSSETEMLSIGVSKDSDKYLLPMINKALICLSDKQLSNIIIKNTMVDHGFSFKAIFYTYPQETVLYIVGILLIIILSLVATIYNNKKKKEEIKSALLEASLFNERFKVALHQIPCDIIEYDFATNSLYYLDKLYGTKTKVPLENKNTFHSFTLCGAVYPELKSIFNNLYERVVSGETTIEVTLKGENNMKECWGRFTLTAVFDGSKPIRMLGTMADVTAEICADHDSLTRLYNRGAFSDKIVEDLAENKYSGYGAFLMIDMDDFKSINDTYGHYAGDICLIYLANKLKLSFRKDDLVARMGGDEFSVFYKGFPSAKHVINKSRQIFDSINQTTVTLKDGTSITIGISMGIAIFPNHGTDFINLYQNADKALYKAKQANKSQLCIYEEDI